MIWYRSKT